MSKNKSYNLIKLKFILITQILCISFSNFQAQNNTNILKKDFEKLTISNQYVYSSNSTIPTINEVINNGSLFTFQQKKFVNSGAFNPYNWIKIELQNNSNQSDFIFEFNQTYVDSLQVFLVKDNQIIKKFKQKGLYFEQNNNSSFLSNKYAYTFPITVGQNSYTTIYIKAILNDGSFRVLNKIWSSEKYKDREKEIKIKTTYLLFFGGFTTLVILLALAMFFFAKKRLYLYYAGFVTVIFLNLVALRYFISPLFIEKYLFFGNNFSEMFGLLQMFLVFQYINHFFSLKKDYPRLSKLTKFFAIITITLFFLSLFMRQFDWFYKFSYYFIKIELIFTTFYSFGIAFYLMFKKNIMAYYFVVAYTPLLFIIGHFILSAMNLTSSFSPLDWEFVVFFEIFVLTIAMAHNYYLLMKENVEYQNRIHNQRAKISRDLHDNIGSQLTFIISSIDNLKFLTKSTNKEITKKLTNISFFTADVISQLRDTIWAMNKNEIPYEDFHGRVLGFIEKAKMAKNTIQFNFTSDVKSKVIFSSVNGINIFRVLQESINNAIKYADASQIDIDITEDKNTLNISIKDNGKGFDMNTVEFGNGLNNMQSRIEEINGKIDVISKINEGTFIHIRIDKNTTNAV